MLHKRHLAGILVTLIVMSDIVSRCRSDLAQLTALRHRQPEVGNSTAHPRCVAGNRTYSVGERYRIDACTTCHCTRHHVTGSTRPHCTVQDCQAIQNCFRLADKKSDNECCQTCVEHGCKHNGSVYADGQVVMETHCERCVCSAGGGPVVCYPKLNGCSRKQLTTSCVDHVFDPATCCRHCPNGGNCWLNDQIIPLGVTVNVSHCRKCWCPPASHVTPFWRRGKGQHAICSDDENCQE